MEDKRYYWLKLKEDFFDEDTIEWLEEQENGKEYCLFYLKLCLKSLKNNGVLIRNVGTMLIPYDAKRLAMLTKTDYDTVIVAIELFKKIGLIEMRENGEIYLSQVESMVGSERKSAERKRKQRLEQQKQLESDEKRCDNVTLMSHECHGELEIEKELDKDIEIEKDNRYREKINNIDTTTNFIYPQLDKYVDFKKEISEDFMNIREPLILWIREAREEVKKHFNSEFRDEDKIYLFSNLIQTLFTILRGKQTGSKIGEGIFHYTLNNVDKLNPDNIGDVLRSIKATFRKAEMQGKEINSFVYILKCLPI